MKDSNGWVLLVARFLIALIFLMSGFHKVTKFSGTVDQIASTPIPLPMVAAVIAIILELAGGLSVLLGYKSKIGSVGLIVFLIPATLFFHNFWAYSGKQFQMQMINFMKNLAIMGGLLSLYVSGPGGLSLGKEN